MSPRARVSLIVATAAVAAAGVTIAATSLTGTDAQTTATPSIRPGVPPLVLDLGVRTDPEARALRRAAALFERKRYRHAGRIFGRYSSPEARVGAALSAWPAGAGRLRALAVALPDSGAAQLAAGLAAFWQRDDAAAQSAWNRARLVQPDTLYAIRAGDLLHPQFPVPGLPVFVSSHPVPAGLERLRPPAQLSYLRQRARRGGAPERLAYGVALQRLNRPVSAEREFRSAAAVAPHDPEALTAAAVGLFDKGRPARAFSRLGPLAKRYPRAATIPFHLGLMLLWLGEVEKAKLQLRQAVALEPRSVPGKQAAAFLARLR